MMARYGGLTMLRSAYRVLRVGEQQILPSVLPQTRRWVSSDTTAATTVAPSFPPQPLVHHEQNQRIVTPPKEPTSDVLTDSFGRAHNYLRISVTERCNLRCLYCMPEEGVPLSPPSHLLTAAEIYYLSSLFVRQGVTKIRLTGGEPTVRRDILPIMHSIGSLRDQGLKELCITTNGISLHRKLDSMLDAGLTGVNLSLDTLDPFQFRLMTRRDGLDAVKRSIDRILLLKKLGAPIQLKINCVVMRGINENEILPFVEMGREHDLEVRFIEYMPFDGNKWRPRKMLGYLEMLGIIREKYPDLAKAQDQPNDTSKTYQVPGFAGRVGFITSMTHNFCGTCNRLRVTSDGNLKVCLFGNAEVSLRDAMRRGNDGKPLSEEDLARMKTLHLAQSSSSDGSVAISAYQVEKELLEVVGMAVQRKKAKHAGMDALAACIKHPFAQATADSMPWSRTVSRRHQLPRRKVDIPGHSLRAGWPVDNPQLPRTMALQRFYSSSTSKPSALTHVTPTGTAHMVAIDDKRITHRIAKAVGYVVFSNSMPLDLIRANAVKKGDVLSVSRIAGIMAAKRTPEWIPLCHPIALTSVQVDLELLSPSTSTPSSSDFGRVKVEAKVECDGKTGVEMEALTAVSAAALNVVDMCKAVDRGMIIEGIRVIFKAGGRRGTWDSESKGDGG